MCHYDLGVDLLLTVFLSMVAEFFWSHKLKSMAVVETQCRHGHTRSLGMGRSFLCVILGSDVWESQSHIKSSAPSKVKKHITNFNYRPYAENIETRKQLREFNKQRHHGVMGKLFFFFFGSKVTLLVKILYKNTSNSYFPSYSIPLKPCPRVEVFSLLWQ